MVDCNFSTATAVVQNGKLELTMPQTLENARNEYREKEKGRFRERGEGSCSEMAGRPQGGFEKFNSKNKLVTWQHSRLT